MNGFERKYGFTAPSMLLAVVSLLAGCSGAAEQAAAGRWSEKERTLLRQARSSESVPDHPVAADMGGSNSEPIDGSRYESSSAQPAFGDLPAGDGMEHHLNHALEHHPGLRVRFEQWRMALERVPQARALTDPRISYSFYVRESMSRQAVGLSQTLPWYGKLRASGESAMEQALAAEQRFEQKRRQVLYRVRSAYAERAYLARTIVIARESLDILLDLEAAVRARFEAGAAPYADVVRAGLEVERMDDRLGSLRARQGAADGRLNEALGRPAGAILPEPGPLRPAAVEVEEEELLALLTEHSPELRALEHEIESAEHRRTLARQSAVPDLTLGVGFMQMVPEDMRNQISVSASINLPIWVDRLRAERAEAEAGIRAARDAHTSRRREMEAELRDAWFRYDDARQRLRRYDERLVPVAREALEATEAAYAFGEVEFQSIIQAQATLEELERMRARLTADTVIGQAELERIVGRTLLEFGVRGSEIPGSPERPATYSNGQSSRLPRTDGGAASSHRHHVHGR